MPNHHNNTPCASMGNRSWSSRLGSEAAPSWLLWH